VLAEISGHDAGGELLSAYTQLRSDGSTACGCWIYCGAYAGGRQPDRAPGSAHPAELDLPAVGVGVAGQPPDPLQPRLRRPAGQAVVAAQGAHLVDRDQWRWVGHDTPDFEAGKRPDYRPASGATGPEAIAGTEPFIMRADGRGWLFAPAGVADGPLPTHYEPQDSPVRNLLHGRQRNPARQTYVHEYNRYHPDPDGPESDVFPYSVTTYRLTEHFTAGGMSRWTPYLAELQPEFFCEVSSELAAERALQHRGWATLVSARGAIEARVLVTDRMTPLQSDGRVIHTIGMPYHWGPNGYARGDSMNELSSMSLDPGHVDHPPRMGFFTDTLVCIGCKACEVACKEWNEVPEDGLNWTGNSHDNTGGLSGSTWRHVAFVEQRVPASGHEPNFQRDDGRLSLADVLRRLQALHARRLFGRLSYRSDLPHRVRDGRRPGRRLQRLRLLRARLPLRRARQTARGRPGVRVHALL
jgi:hypothetical protein